MLLRCFTRSHFLAFCLLRNSGRVSHALGLRGPCFTIDTACSCGAQNFRIECDTHSYRKLPFFYGKTHYTWPFSIAMFSYQRVETLWRETLGECQSKRWNFMSSCNHDPCFDIICFSCIGFPHDLSSLVYPTIHARNFGETDTYLHTSFVDSTQVVFPQRCQCYLCKSLIWNGRQQIQIPWSKKSLKTEISLVYLQPKTTKNNSPFHTISSTQKKIPSAWAARSTLVALDCAAQAKRLGKCDRSVATWWQVQGLKNWTKHEAFFYWQISGDDVFFPDVVDDTGW